MSIVFHAVEWRPEAHDDVLTRYPERLIARSETLREARVLQSAEERSGNLGVLLDWIYWSCSGRRATEEEVRSNVLRARLTGELERVVHWPIHTCPRVLDVENATVTFVLGRFSITWALVRESGVLLSLVSIEHPLHGRLDEFVGSRGETPSIDSLEGVDWSVLNRRLQAFEDAALKEPWIAENYGQFVE